MRRCYDKQEDTHSPFIKAESKELSAIIEKNRTETFCKSALCPQCHSHNDSKVNGPASAMNTIRLLQIYSTACKLHLSSGFCLLNWRFYTFRDTIKPINSSRTKWDSTYGGVQQSCNAPIKSIIELIFKYMRMPTKRINFHRPLECYQLVKC